MQMMITSDETQIQIFADWPMSHAKRVTEDNRKNPEYHVVAAIRRLRTDKNCPAEKSWPNHVEIDQHIGSKKTYVPQNTEQFKHNGAKDRKRKCCRQLRFHACQSTSTPFPSLWFIEVV